MTIEIDYEMLAVHAGHIGTSATDVSLAAAATATVSDEAFGILCSFLPPILNTYWPTNQAGIRSASGTLTGVQDSLQGIIDLFAERDWNEKRAADLIRQAIT